MLKSPSAAAYLNRFITSLAAIAAVSVIFGAKALESERAVSDARQVIAAQQQQ